MYIYVQSSYLVDTIQTYYMKPTVVLVLAAQTKSQLYYNLRYSLCCSIFIRAALDDGEHNTTQQVQLVHISFGNTDMAAINIFSLWKTTSGEKHLLFIRMFLHQNSFAIIIKSPLLLFLCAGLLMLQQHIWF